MSQRDAFRPALPVSTRRTFRSLTNCTNASVITFHVNKWNSTSLVTSIVFIEVEGKRVVIVS